MSERVHMTAPDGRTITLQEWGAYLDAHPSDVDEPYRRQDGRIYEVDGFRFNVHGVCLNPHTIHIAPEGDRIGGVLCYIDIRTYRKAYSIDDRRVVWWCSDFSMNAGFHAFGRLSPDDPDEEREIIVRGLLNGIESQSALMEWLEKMIENEDVESGRRTELARVKKMRELAASYLDQYRQLSLF